MDLDLDRWHRLRAAAADAEHDGPSFVDVQAANGRWAQARGELEIRDYLGHTSFNEAKVYIAERDRRRAAQRAVAKMDIAAAVKATA